MESPISIIWDWNGTLLDDTDAEVRTLDGMLARRGLNPVGREYFREHFAFPARDFYNRVGMKVPDDEWAALAREYHDHYLREPLALNAEAVAALELVRDRGVSQSILSALRQDLLEQALCAFGLTGYFGRICGVDNLDGGSKLDRARELMAALDGESRPVLIGDSLHDKEVADAIGAGCVLFSGGSHAGHRLRKVAPTGDTLLECVEMALGNGVNNG